MAADVLSDLLKTVRLTGAAFFDIAAEAPWAVASPPPELILPRILPGADHLIAYHVVTAGRCYATFAGGNPVVVEAGEVIIFTNGDPHVMSSAGGMHAEPPTADVLAVAAAAQMPYRLNYCGSGRTATHLVCGYLACDARPYNPLLAALPPVMKAGSPQDHDASWLGQFIRWAISETADKRAGGDTILTKLSELMFIEVVRRYIETLPADNSGWLAGLRDSSIGKALSLIHARPEFGWTNETLARQTGLSRSVFAKRFAQLVGIPPMHYVAKWRMQIASELLTTGNANIATISAKIGYESEEAFSRAFKKMMSMPPAAWRRRGKAEGNKAG